MSFNVEEFIAYAEELESASHEEEEEEQDTDSDCADTIHELIVKVLKKLPSDLRVPVGTLFSLSLQDETIFQIDTVEELQDKLAQICPSKAQAVQVSKRKAKECLGVDVRNVKIGGEEYTQYSPISGTTGEIVLISRQDVDTFSTLLVEAFIQTAFKYEISDNFTHLATDNDTYEAAAKTGGKYRPFVLIKPDEEGVIQYQAPDPSVRVVYEIQPGSKANFFGKVIPLGGELLAKFCEGNAYTNSGVSDGIQSPCGNMWINGPYDPVTFMNGHPDSSDETLAVVLDLIKPTKTGFIQRYKSVFVDKQESDTLRAAPRVVETKGWPSLTNEAKPSRPTPAEYYQPAPRGRAKSRAGAKAVAPRRNESQAPARVPDEAPHWRNSLNKTKTISPNCNYTWSTPDECHPPVSVDRQQDNFQPSVNGLIEEACQALLWLKQQPGSQLSDVAVKYPNTHSYAVSAIEQIGEGSTKKKLLEFVRTHKKARVGHQNFTITQVANEAETKGVIPGITLLTPQGEIEAPATLTLPLFLLRLCASLVFTKRAGPQTQFYWQEKKY